MEENELKKIVDSEHHNPHNFLGIHQEILNSKPVVIVRCFLPRAQKVSVIDTNLKKYPMEKIDDAGVFQVNIGNKKIFDYQLEVTDYDGNTQKIFDPYSFEPVISDFDLFLFGEGNHYKIFDKLGAHPLQIKNVSGVNFAVWAPNAKRVSVIGDFNNWDGRQNPMRARKNSGVWELFIPGLKNFDKYKFEIKTQENYILKKSDPYGNFAQLRPDNASVIFDINKYKWNDAAWRSLRTKNPPTSGPINIYEVHLGSWKRIVEEDNRFLTYREFADEIVPYIKKMNYTHIELMPIAEHPFDGSWGYQVTGYYAVTSRYGTPENFMYLVDKCHQNNIGVILDWVPAHFPKDEHGLAHFDGTALYEHADPRMGEHPDWGTLIFNYGRCEVKNFLIANALFWIEKFHIDGLRVDAVASMIYLDYSKKEGQWLPNKFGGNENLDAIEFMKHMNSVICGKYPEILMIAEESTAWPGVSRPVEQNGLGFNLKWNMGWMNDFLTYMQKDPIHRKFHHNNLTFSMIYAYTENFILVLSHDEVVHGKGSLISKMPGDLWQKFANLRVAFGFMIGHPGKKLSFMGNEFAQFDEWNENKSLDWHLLNFESHEKFQTYIKDLNEIYCNEKTLSYDDFTNNGFEWIDCNDSDRSVISFMRKGKNPNDIIIFVCNFTPVPLLTHRIGVPFPGIYKEILNSDDLKYGGSGIVNSNIIQSEKIEWNWRQNSIGLKIPPLGVSIIKLC